MSRRKRVVMSRWSTPEEHGNRSFDLAFWQSVSSEARLAAAWDLVKHYVEVNGGDPNQLRLQRHRERLVFRAGPLPRRRRRRGA